MVALPLIVEPLLAPARPAGASAHPSPCRSPPSFPAALPSGQHRTAPSPGLIPVAGEPPPQDSGVAAYRRRSHSSCRSTASRSCSVTFSIIVCMSCSFSLMIWRSRPIFIGRCERDDQQSPIRWFRLVAKACRSATLGPSGSGRHFLRCCLGRVYLEDAVVH